MRFTAPLHISEAFLSTGPVSVVEGVLTLPDDASTGDIAGVQAAGFVQIPEEAPTQAKPAKPKGE